MANSKLLVVKNENNTILKLTITIKHYSDNNTSRLTQNPTLLFMPAKRRGAISFSSTSANSIANNSATFSTNDNDNSNSNSNSNSNNNMAFAAPAPAPGGFSFASSSSSSTTPAPAFGAAAPAPAQGGAFGTSIVVDFSFRFV